MTEQEHADINHPFQINLSGTFVKKNDKLFIKGLDVRVVGLPTDVGNAHIVLDLLRLITEDLVSRFMLRM